MPGCAGRHVAKGLCRHHYNVAWDRANRPSGPPRSLADRFWEKVARDGPTQPHMDTPCWEWQGATHKDGYGVIYLDGKHALAHRVSFELQHGSHDLFVLHRCDNRACVRPDHLMAGTQTENVQDMNSKGRHRPAAGEANGRARLTPDAVRAARAAHAEGASTASLARLHGVSECAMQYAIKRRSWRMI